MLSYCGLLYINLKLQNTFDMVTMLCNQQDGWNFTDLFSQKLTTLYIIVVGISQFYFCERHEILFPD